MEVAGQWRREWAGTAEYGKVIEGGVTRQVARAMEVLHASAPGARVRVVRAAYHSSAGPGAPASSYMMHSSRQVISSGYNFLEPSSLPSKPLEISSTPLDTSPDSEIENENYKVTEPDDYEISEPSKWRSTSKKNSLRMPSEESSSTDNASIIDLDSRASSRSTLRRSFRNKEDVHRVHTINTRVSPLLDAPVALSTLKYTSLLNGSDDWNSRRKSYSFEGSSPINKSISSENSFTIDSSTDSGICKSSEIVNDYLNNNKYANIPEKVDHNQEESFTEWLSRNRSMSYKDVTPPKIYNKQDFHKNEDKITVKSSGKVSITLPIDSPKDRKNGTLKSDDCDRRTKKVEFCKTELHFAVDTGTVNIIATDEKPPPSNDFRRRRSAFVPLNEKIEKSITLFGEKNELSDNITQDNSILSCDFANNDENTAATKSILKNKIPKPKPYLLGENMAFGNFSDNANVLEANKDFTTSSAVSLINRQLQSQTKHSDETLSSCASDPSTALDNTFRAESKGLKLRGSSNYKQTASLATEPLKRGSPNSKTSSMSENKTKMRELRGSDLAYFGIDKTEKAKIIHSQDNIQEEIFHSVKLVQKISNSVCNSEADSDEAPEYQNILPRYNFTPIPKPRSVYSGQVREEHEPRILKPIIEHDLEKLNIDRFNSRKQNEAQKPQYDNALSPKLPKEKNSKQNDIKSIVKNGVLTQERNKTSSLKRVKSNKENETAKSRSIKIDKNTPETPLYINLQKKSYATGNKNKLNDQHRLQSPNAPAIRSSRVNTKQSTVIINDDNIQNKIKGNHGGTSTARNNNNENLQETSPHSRKQAPRRTEKLTTPDHLQDRYIRQRSYTNDKIIKTSNEYDTQNTNSSKRNKDIPKVLNHSSNKPKKLEGSKNSSSENKVNIQNSSKIINNITQSKENSNDNKTPLKVHEGPTNGEHIIKLSNNKIMKTANTKPHKTSKSKRSKYIINYDDKNGTVSSICKIKSAPGTYTRKLISVENKNPQEYTRDKSINKIASKK